MSTGLLAPTTITLNIAGGLATSSIVTMAMPFAGRITGAYVALCLAVKNLGMSNKFITGQIAAVSVGVVGGVPLLDLCYEEDSRAQVDMNVVALADGRYVEVQGTAEGLPYDRVMMNKLLDVAQVGLDQLFAEQVKAINR